MNRDDFPILKNNLIYFDNGATTLKPKCVIDKVVDYYQNYSANAHRGDYDISFKVDEEYEKAREIVRRFINANLIFYLGKFLKKSIMVKLNILN